MKASLFLLPSAISRTLLLDCSISHTLPRRSFLHYTIGLDCRKRSGPDLHSHASPSRCIIPSAAGLSASEGRVLLRLISRSVARSWFSICTKTFLSSPSRQPPPLPFIAHSLIVCTSDRDQSSNATPTDTRFLAFRIFNSSPNRSPSRCQGKQQAAAGSNYSSRALRTQTSHSFRRNGFVVQILEPNRFVSRLSRTVFSRHGRRGDSRV